MSKHSKTVRRSPYFGIEVRAEALMPDRIARRLLRSRYRATERLWTILNLWYWLFRFIHASRVSFSLDHRVLRNLVFEIMIHVNVMSKGNYAYVFGCQWKRHGPRVNILNTSCAIAACPRILLGEVLY